MSPETPISSSELTWYTGTNLYIYPCDRGTRLPVGFHHFEAGPTGVVVCVYCGKAPR